MYLEARMRIHQQKHKLAEPCFFFIYVIYNKPYFRYYCGPSACRTVCGEPYGSIFFREPCHP